MYTEDKNRKLAWLWSALGLPVCPRCLSPYTYKYILDTHGYGCIDCGMDFGKVLKLCRA